ncbi:MAG: VanZ family protein [Coriobacteriales bacterium]|jgi:glycopeptide antibiotics resistance protein|nr:VanZ family protein [Coriobacteriales bacterium]
MRVYLNNIWVAVLTFPLIAAFCTLPYVIYQYRKYGSIPLWRSLLVFAFIFYLLCCYYLVILPLPEDRQAVVPYATTPQLVPFHFVQVFLANNHLTLHNLISSPIIYGVFFNILLTLPFGMFLRYYFRANWWQITLAGLALSLFFELTQLSGLYGLYAHPYRLFDVDDLIQNTCGAWLGGLIALPLRHLLPDMRQVNAKARLHGTRVSLMRRAFAFLIDLTIGGILGFWLSSPLALLVFFWLVPWLSHGRTLGHLILKLRIVSDAQRPPQSRSADSPAIAPVSTGTPSEALIRPRARQYLERYGSLYLFLFVPYWAVRWLNQLDFNHLAASNLRVFSFLQGAQGLVDALWLLLMAVWLVSLAVRALLAWRRQSALVMLNERISHTYLVTK